MPHSKRGITKFKHCTDIVIAKLTELKDYEVIAGNSLKRYSDAASTCIQILKNHESMALEQHRNRINYQYTGLIAKIVAALIALISIWFFEATVPTPVTAISVGGTIIKIANSYMSRKKNKAILKQVDEYLQSEIWNKLRADEMLLETRITRIIQILKNLYGDGDTNTDLGKVANANSPDENTAANELKLKNRTPLLINVMKGAKKISKLHDKINSVLEHSAEFGIESMEVIEQGYDAALTGFGEVIPFAWLELTIRSITLFLASYELHHLVGSSDISGPTAKIIREHIIGQQEKVKVYRDTLRSICLFMAIRVNS